MVIDIAGFIGKSFLLLMGLCLVQPVLEEIKEFLNKQGYNLKGLASVNRDTGSLPMSYARQLTEKYNKAYDSHAECELADIVEELISLHYASSSARDLDNAILFEGTVKERPYIYHGDRTDYDGLPLIEIFRWQNDHIRKLQGI